jgi:hypothetical protein
MSSFYYVYHKKEDERGGTCSTHRDEKLVRKFELVYLKEEIT